MHTHIRTRARASVRDIALHTRRWWWRWRRQRKRVCAWVNNSQQLIRIQAKTSCDCESFEKTATTIVKQSIHDQLQFRLFRFAQHYAQHLQNLPDIVLNNHSPIATTRLTHPQKREVTQKKLAIAAAFVCTVERERENTCIYAHQTRWETNTSIRTVYLTGI